MSEEMGFFIYLLESYADHKQMLSRDALGQWDERGVSDEVMAGYWGYHTEAIENAFADIDSLVATGRHAW